jgi:hypothetical protein
MDANVTLRQLRAIAALAVQAREDSAVIDYAALLDEMAESFQALDNWLQRGGFLPTSWAKAAWWKQLEELKK